MRIIKRRLRDVGWWFKYRLHPRHRYHVVKFGPPGWYDRDHAMFLCCFKLLDEFVTGELDNPDSVKTDWQATPEHRHAIQEIRSLHFWWRHQRDAECTERDSLFSQMWDEVKGWGPDPFDDPNDSKVGFNPFFDRLHTHPLYTEYQNLDRWVNGRDQAQLERLIKIRGYLWT